VEVREQEFWSGTKTMYRRAW